MLIDDDFVSPPDQIEPERLRNIVGTGTVHHHALALSVDYMLWL